MKKIASKKTSIKASNTTTGANRALKRIVEEVIVTEKLSPVPAELFRVSLALDAGARAELVTPTAIVVTEAEAWGSLFKFFLLPNDLKKLPSRLTKSSVRVVRDLYARRRGGRGRKPNLPSDDVAREAVRLLKANLVTGSWPCYETEGATSASATEAVAS